MASTRNVKHGAHDEGVGDEPITNVRQKFKINVYFYLVDAFFSKCLIAFRISESMRASSLHLLSEIRESM